MDRQINNIFPNNMTDISYHFQSVYYVYIVGNEDNKRLEVGLTDNIRLKMRELALGSSSSCCTRLLYYESFTNKEQAVSRELQLNGYFQWMLRRIIKRKNPERKVLNRELDTII